MELKKYFFFRITGLFGVLYTILGLITFLITIYNNFKLTRNTDSFIKQLLSEPSFRIFLFINIIILTIALVLLFIGISSGKISYENQIVGLIFIFMGLINLRTVYLQVSNYLSVRNNTETKQILEIYRSNIIQSIYPVILPIVMGLILFFINYHKTEAYDGLDK